MDHSDRFGTRHGTKKNGDMPTSRASARLASSPARLPRRRRGRNAKFPTGPKHFRSFEPRPPAINNKRLIEPMMGSRARPVASVLCRLDSKSNECAQTTRPRTLACNRVRPCARACRTAPPHPYYYRKLCVNVTHDVLAMCFTPKIALFSRRDPFSTPTAVPRAASSSDTPRGA